MKYDVKEWLDTLRTKTMHSICSGVSEGKNEVAGRIRFLAKFKQPKAIALGAIVLAVFCVAVFCLGGDNPITTAQSEFDTDITNQSTADTENSENSEISGQNIPSSWSEATLLQLVQERYTQILQDGEVSAYPDDAIYEDMMQTELTSFASAHYVYLFSEENASIQVLFLEGETYVGGAENSIATQEQALDAATIFLQAFCVEPVSVEDASFTVEMLGSGEYSITFLWVNEADILTGERAAIILRTDGTLIAFTYNATEALADGLDISAMISEQEAIAFAYAALDEVEPDAAHEIEAYQEIADGTVLWKITIANVLNPELNPALGDVYTQTVWINVDAFTGDIAQTYYSR